jgi:hypothetical protein
MKEYKYRGYEYPIIVDDNGKITYRGREVEKYVHGYKVVGMASGFSYKTLAKQHYVREMDKIDNAIRMEEYRKEHKEEFDNLTTVEEDIEWFFSMMEE